MDQEVITETKNKSNAKDGIKTNKTYSPWLIGLLVVFLFLSGYFSYQNIKLNDVLINLKSSVVELEKNHEYLNNLFTSTVNKERPWFTKLSNALIDNQILLTEITDYRESTDGRYVVLLLSGIYCDPPNVFRFDTKDGEIKKAEIIDKDRGCMASGGYFSSPKSGDTSEILTNGGDAGCRNRMYFSYDVDTNIALLVKEASICEGEEEETWTDY